MEHSHRYSNPPYIEPPTHAPNTSDDINSLRGACNTLSSKCDVLTQRNETLHQKLSHQAVHLKSLQSTGADNAQLLINYKQENAKLRMLLQSQSGGVLVPPIMFSSLTDNHSQMRDYDNRIKMLEDRLSLSERESDRCERMSGSSGGGLSSVSLSSSAVVLEPSTYTKESAYSSLSSLDSITLRERVHELEKECMGLKAQILKQEAKSKILEHTLRDKQVLIKGLKRELDQFRAQYREFSQI